MRDLDDIDIEILRSLVTDARRPYREIAERVDLSPPAVSDRISRLEEQGVIRGFTVDVDRSKLRRNVPVLVELEVKPGRVDEVYDDVTTMQDVEHVFEGMDGRLLVHANLPTEDARSWLESGIELGALHSYDVTLLSRSDRNVGLSATSFTLPCVVCGKTVEGDGVTATFDGEIKTFCCPSCEARYEERYETHQEALE